MMPVNRTEKRLAKMEEKCRGLDKDRWAQILKLATDEEIEAMIALYSKYQAKCANQLPPEAVNQLHDIVAGMCNRLASGGASIEALLP